MLVLAMAAVEIGFHLAFQKYASPSSPPTADPPTLVTPYSNLRDCNIADATEQLAETNRRCGVTACHPTVARQHDMSAHGRSFENDAFKAELKKFIEDRGRPAADYCLACHAPLGVVAHPADGRSGRFVDP